MKSSYKKFGGDVLIMGIARVSLSLCAIISLPLITKLLGAYSYGIWTQVNVTVQLLWTLVNFGLPFAMIRFLAAETNREEIQDGFYSVFSVVSLVTLIVSFIVIAFADSIAKAFFDGAVNIVRITGLIILMSSLNLVSLHLFRAFRQIKRYAIFTVTKTYIQTGAIAYLALNGFGIFSVVLSILIIEAILFPILLYSIKSQIGIKRPRFSRLKEYFSFGLPLVPTNASSWVVSLSDRYVIGYFLGVTSVGIYSAGYGLGSVIVMPAALLGFILPPTLSKLYDEGRMDEVKTYLSYSLKYLLALAIPFVFGATLLSKELLIIFSTPEIASQGYYIVPLVALSILLLTLSEPVAEIIFLVKKTRITGVAWLLAALINLGLNLLLVPHIGILGAAITTLIAYLLVLVILAYYGLKEVRFNIHWHFIIKSLIASAIMSLAIWFIAPVGTLTVILTVVLGVIIYGAVLLLLRGFSREEIKFFRGMFKKG